MGCKLNSMVVALAVVLAAGQVAADVIVTSRLSKIGVWGGVSNEWDESGSYEDTKETASNDFFDDTVSGLAEVTNHSFGSTASQTSGLTIVGGFLQETSADGDSSVFASDETGSPEGGGGGEGFSIFTIEFDVLGVPTPFRLLGEINSNGMVRTYDYTHAEVILSNADTSTAIESWYVEGDDIVEFDLSGMLSPGSYQLYAMAYSNRSAFASDSAGFNVTLTVPEPGSLAMLLGVALTALGYAWRRRVNILSVFPFFLAPFFLKSRSTIIKTRFVLLIVGMVVLCQDSQSPAKTYVIPHVLEKSGTINDTLFTFDTTIFADYVGAAPPTANLYLYDRSTGGLMTSGTGEVVANPYGLSFDAATRSASVRGDDLITSHGGFADNGIKLGFGVLVVGGQDPDGVNLQGFVVNSHTSTSDLSVFGFEPEPIQASVAKRSFVLPHVLEKAGKTGLAGNPGWGGCTDTLLYPTYVGGLLGIPESSATLQLTLFNNDGSRMFSDGEAFDYQTVLDSGNRSPLVCLEDIIQDRGGFGGAAKEGYLAVNITGDAGNVAIQGFVVNSHTNPFDLTFSPVPEPGTLSLVGILGVCLGGYVWRRQTL